MRIGWRGGGPGARGPADPTLPAWSGRFAGSHRESLAHRPPFGRLVLRQTQAKRAETAGRGASAYATELRAAAEHDAEVLGPAPAFAAKRAGSFRVQLVLRGPLPERLLDRVPPAAEWTVDVDPVTLLG